jgi:glycosyltransferase involved in cell wall biosynthesis
LLADAARALTADGIAIVAHGPVSADVRERLGVRSGGSLSMPGVYRPEDLARRMAGVDLVLVPSLWPETFSIVVREAWAHGKPVLASETGALVEAAGPGRDRVRLLPPGDAAAWIAAIRRLAGDAAEKARLAGPHVPESFEAMLAATMACYMERP